MLNLVSFSLTKESLLLRVEHLLWAIYLLFLVGLSFLSFRYESRSWVYFAGLFYLYCSVYLLVLLAGVNFNRKALYVARVPVILLLLMLLWVITQALLPIPNKLYTSLFISGTVPSWFDPRLTFSTVPKITHWLFFTNLFVLFWFVLTLAVITTRQRVKQLLVTIILIGLFHALIGLYAKFGNLILVDQQAVDGHFNVARGLFVNRNHYASFISITLVGAITYFLKGLMHEWQQRKPLLAILDLLLSPKIIYISATMVGLIALILSQSRAGLFGLICAFFIVFSLLIVFDKRFYRKRIVLIVLAILFVGLFQFFGQDILSRLSTEGFTLGERLLQWKITWAAIVDAPILGYGAGSYSTIFQIYREHEDLRQVVFDQSHNEYLQLWLEQGIIGFALFMAFIVVVIRQSVKMYQRSPSSLVSALSVSSMIVVLAALAQAMVDFNLQIINIRCFFFVIIGLMFASISLLKEKQDNNKNN